MFLHMSVIHSVHRGGSTWPGTPPWDQVPPLGTRYTPQDQVHPPGPGTPPGTRYSLRDQVPPGTRYTPHADHAERYGQCVGGTHPTGMQSCFL